MRSFSSLDLNCKVWLSARTSNLPSDVIEELLLVPNDRHWGLLLVPGMLQMSLPCSPSLPAYTKTSRSFQEPNHCERLSREAGKTWREL